MAQERQTSEWAQTMFLLGGVGNMFRKPGEQKDLTKFLPPHLGGGPGEAGRAPEPTPEQVAANWDGLLMAADQGRMR